MYLIFFVVPFKLDGYQGTTKSSFCRTYQLFVHLMISTISIQGELAALFGQLQQLLLVPEAVPVAEERESRVWGPGVGALGGARLRAGRAQELQGGPKLKQGMRSERIPTPILKSDRIGRSVGRLFSRSVGRLVGLS